MTHSPSITQIDTVRAYHSGPRIILEVDIVMSPNETLQVTHDVAEELQFKLESLPDVERAYVHVDYETSHKPVSGTKAVFIALAYYFFIRNISSRRSCNFLQGQQVAFSSVLEDLCIEQPVLMPL